MGIHGSNTYLSVLQREYERPDRYFAGRSMAFNQLWTLSLTLGEPFLDLLRREAGITKRDCRAPMAEPVYDMSTAGRKWLRYQERDLENFLFHEVFHDSGKVQAYCDVDVPGNWLTDDAGYSHFREK